MKIEIYYNWRILVFELNKNEVTNLIEHYLRTRLKESNPWEISLNL